VSETETNRTPPGYPRQTGTEKGRRPLWVCAALLLILLIGGFLRLYRLSRAPKGFHFDEAANGYEAYSLLRTGRDSRGVPWPLVFTHHNVNYFEGLYIYLVVPSVRLLGLTESAVRLPAAILGTLTLLSCFFLARALFDRRVALVATLLLALSVWHLHYSRIGLKPILLPFLLLPGLCFLLKGARKGPWLLAAAPLLSLALYSYTPAKLFVPLLVLLFLLVSRRDLLRSPGWSALFLGLFFLGALPALVFGLTDEGAHRFREIAYAGKVSHGQALLLFLKGYLKHFAPYFLFRFRSTKGFWVHGLGVLHLFEIPLLGLGLYRLLRTSGKERPLLLGWLLLAPIPAALVLPAPVPLRCIGAIPVYSILCALGFQDLWKRTGALGAWRPGAWKVAVIRWAFLTLAIANLAVDLGYYYFVYPDRHASFWHYGYREALGELEKRKDMYPVVLVSRNLTLPYIYILFYTRHDPGNYQRNPVHLGGFKNSGTIGRYRLLSRPLRSEDRHPPKIGPPKDSPLPGRLLLSRDAHPNWRVVREIHYPDGGVALRILASGGKKSGGAPPPAAQSQAQEEGCWDR
jgi:4-amino-4-deoxy-L-arabinose transferase-like glycosyltransferase